MAKHGNTLSQPEARTRLLRLFLGQHEFRCPAWLGMWMPRGHRIVANLSLTFSCGLQDSAGSSSGTELLFQSE